MKKKILIITQIIIIISIDCIAQSKFVRNDSIPVSSSGKNLTNPWAGGFNSPQFSPIDLNGDGIKDLFVFERNNEGRVKTFINRGTPDTVAYDYSPEFQNRFPKMQNWVLLVDYNCDGKEDIFTSFNDRIAVYRNDYTIDKGLLFTLISLALYTNRYGENISLYVSSVDLPAISDIDNDGDLDILTFGVSGNVVEYHKNLSLENYGTCDSLIFELKNACWGYFSESGLNNSVILFDTCSNNVSNPEKTTLHSGSTLLALELLGNGVKDLIIGDISYNNMVMLNNGGTPKSSIMIAKDSLFPSNTTPINIPIFPAGYYLDVNNDKKKDLLISPNSVNNSENYTSVWYYQNTGSESAPVFTFIKNNFLQDEMIDVGEGANPLFFDYNSDGKQDIIVGNYGYYNKSGDYSGSILLLENTGSLSSPSFKFITKDYAMLSSYGFNGIYPTIGDLDDDGDLDMLIGDYDGYLHYFINNAGTGNPANFSLSQLNYKNIDVGQFATPQLIDINRDGLLDLLIGERSGNLNYFKNTGTKQVADFNSLPDNNFFGGIDVMVPCCTGYSSPFMTTDQSGKYILFVGSEQGIIYVYKDVEENINGAFKLTDSINTQGYRVSISGGYDVNDDGNIEYLIGEYTGGMAIYKHDTSSLDYVKKINNENENEDKIIVYSDLSNNKIIIEFKTVNPEANNLIEIFNIAGAKIFTERISQNCYINTKNIQTGLYYIKITNANWYEVKKIVIVKNNN